MLFAHPPLKHRLLAVFFLADLITGAVPFYFAGAPFFKMDITITLCTIRPFTLLNAAFLLFRHFSSPFFSADEEIEKVKKEGARVIIVDMHAEATSEKSAISWYLDGRVSAVVGSHTHVQTADERVSQKGTACLTDLGMTGPYDSVIGAEKELIIRRFLTQIHSRKEVARGDVRLCGAIVAVDEHTGKAISIERVQKKVT